MGLREWDSVPAHNKGFKDGNSSAATASSLWASDGGTVYLHTLDNSRKENKTVSFTVKKKEEETKNISNEEVRLQKNSAVFRLPSRLYLLVPITSK